MNLPKGLLIGAGLVLLASLPASASHIDVGASGHGPAIGNEFDTETTISPSAADVATCASQIGTGPNCEAFDTSSFPVTIDVNGVATSVSGAAFSFVNADATNTGEKVNVYQLPFAVSAGMQVSLTFENLTEPFGVFACGNGTNNFVTDSFGAALSGLPCTTGTVGLLSSLYTESESGNTATFDFPGGAGFPTTWVFYSDSQDPLESVSSVVATPEPSTLLLLMLGLLGTAALATYRRSRADQ